MLPGYDTDGQCSEEERNQKPGGALSTYRFLSPNTLEANAIGAEWRSGSCIFKEIPGHSGAWPGFVNSWLSVCPWLAVETRP